MSNHVSNTTSNVHQLDGFFEPLTNLLLDFAAKYRMRIDKYWHGCPSWRFGFRHPKGGLACIEVFREGENQSSIYGYWWKDDYDQGVRFLLTRKTDTFELDLNKMANSLEETLDNLIAAPVNSWTDKAQGFGEHWQRTFTKDEFEQLENDYPVLAYTNP